MGGHRGQMAVSGRDYARVKSPVTKESAESDSVQPENRQYPRRQATKIPEKHHMNNCPKNHPCVKPALRQHTRSCRAHHHDPRPNRRHPLIVWPGRQQKWVSRFFQKWVSRFFHGRQGAGCEEADSEPCLEGCGLRTKCGNRGQRTRLQWWLCRLRRCFGFGSFVAVGR